MEKNLVQMTTELFDEIDDMVNVILVSSGVTISDVSEMSDEDFKMLQKTLSTFNKSKSYYMVVAEKLDKLDEIDRKLDKLLKIEC